MVAGLLQKIHWHLNAFMTRHLWLLNVVRGRLTVENAFGAPGDTLLSAMLCQILKTTFPRIRVNLVTAHSELVFIDPYIETINAPESYFHLRFWYLETATAKRGDVNILQETLQKIGIQEYDYQSKVFLSAPELEQARCTLGTSERIRIAFSTRTKEKVKNWPFIQWKALLSRMASEVELIQLGDSSEPEFLNVTRFAGHLSMRQSMAIVANCDLFVGGVSFLMHAANGVNVSAVIIYGGRESPANSGYRNNHNIYVPIACGPCWLHDSQGDVCPYDVACMNEISVDEVETAIRKQLGGIFATAS